MKFLLVEILIWLIAASILGLVIGWLFKALFSRRKFNQAKSRWDNEYAALKTTSSQEISALNDSLSTMETDNSTLQSKVGSLSAMVKSMETALLKANAENKALSTTVSSQQLTINEIRIESENLIKRQSELQMELNSLEKAKEQEFDSLKSQLSSASGRDADHGNDTDDGDTDSDDNKMSGTPGVTRLTPVLRSVTDNDSTSDIDQKIKNLNEQRDRLNREREELFNQEQHFASQLTRGDDTEAYLDQTIRIDEDLTATIQSDTSELHTAAADPADTLSSTLDNSLATSNADIPHEEDHNKPKSLWDKFKSSMHPPADKPKA